jgi:hypothetical protein
MEKAGSSLRHVPADGDRDRGNTPVEITDDSFTSSPFAWRARK